MKRIGVLGPPVMFGAGGIVESMVMRRGVDTRGLSARSNVRTRHSSRSCSGSGAARSAGSRRAE